MDTEPAAASCGLWCIDMDLPVPLTPVDCDLTDFAFMPLDVARLRDSELASNESPEACWAAVQLWAASWHQIPAGSVPNDDKWLAKATGYGRIVKEWMRVRAGALRGWVECTDSRLYHTVVCEKALEAWKAKIEQRYRTEVARVKKHNQRHGTTHSTPEFSDWLSLGRPSGHYLSVPGDKPQKTEDNTGDKPSKGEGEGEGEGQGQGQGQGQGDSSSVAKATDAAGGAPAKKDKPPKTPEEMAKAELWRAAVSVLEQGGCPPSQCRTFMGKLVTDYTFPVVKDAVAAAVNEQPADAREYLKATCQHAAGQRQHPNKQEALEASNRAVLEKFLAKDLHAA